MFLPRRFGAIFLLILKSKFQILYDEKCLWSLKISFIEDYEEKLICNPSKTIKRNLLLLLFFDSNKPFLNLNEARKNFTKVSNFKFKNNFLVWLKKTYRNISAKWSCSSNMSQSYWWINIISNKFFLNNLSVTLCNIFCYTRWNYFLRIIYFLQNFIPSFYIKISIILKIPLMRALHKAKLTN